MSSTSKTGVLDIPTILITAVIGFVAFAGSNAVIDVLTKTHGPITGYIYEVNRVITLEEFSELYKYDVEFKAASVVTGSTGDEVFVTDELSSESELNADFLTFICHIRGAASWQFYVSISLSFFVMLIFYSTLIRGSNAYM